MFYIEAIIYFVLGTLIGSFLNVVIYRYHQSNWQSGRSMCFSCGKNLRWFELVPVFSYLIQKGRCRRCKSVISKQYIFVELLTGLLFAGIALLGITGANAFVPLLVMSLMVIILVYDIHHKIIPDGIVYVFIVVAFLHLFFTFDPFTFYTPSLSALLAGPLLFLPFFCIWYFSKGRWMGLGDGKLVLGFGWFLGFEAGLSAIVLSFWIGAIVALLMLLYQKLKSRKRVFTLKSEIPFAPFLIAGFLVTYYFAFSLADLIL